MRKEGDNNHQVLIHLKTHPLHNLNLQLILISCMEEKWVDRVEIDDLI